MDQNQNPNLNPAITVDITEADDQTLLWLADLDSDKELGDLLNSFKLSENKNLLIRDEIQLVGIGKISIDGFMERLNNLIFEKGDIEKAGILQSLVLYVLGHMSQTVLEKPENAEFHSLRGNSADSPVTQKPSSTSILEGLATHPADDIEDKELILSGIENPQSTIPVPAFVLPNTKPKTADVLKGLAAEPIASGSIPATMPTSFPPELDLDLDTAGIVDPIRAAPRDNAPVAPYTNPSQMSSPQPGISIQMDSKLTSVTGTATKESFKVMPLSETMKSLAEKQNAKAPGTATIGVQRADPYREPIE